VQRSDIRGIAVGDADGDSVGDSVGDSDGDFVGDFVGDALRVAVIDSPKGEIAVEFGCKVVVMR